MTALATLEDLEAVGGSIEDPARAQRLLEMASAVVETYCRRSFAFVEDDELTLYTTGALWLPNGPIVSVTSVTNADAVDQTFELVGSEVRWTGTAAWPTGRLDWYPGFYDIVYSHGYDPIPDDVILAVCRMTAAALGSSDVAAGVESTTDTQTLGAWSESATVRYSASVSGSAIASDPDLSSLLAPYRQQAGSILMVR